MAVDNFFNMCYNNLMIEKNQTLGWGVKSNDGAEIWDAEPVFLNERVSRKDWFKLLFFPKKWFLYWWVMRGTRNGERGTGVIRVLDVGCGTGADMVDFKKIFGRKSEVFGVDVVKLQVDLAREKIKKHGVWADVKWYDGQELPFPDEYFNAVYTSDVLGHVADVQSWLSEISRVLKPGGALAMFAESKLGRHAFIRNYLMKRGLNIDPHAEFHISLYSKNILREYIEAAGFEIKKMYGAFWASFFVHPDEFTLLNSRLLPTGKSGSAEGRFNRVNPFKYTFPVLRLTNKILYKIKKKLHPYSTALCELYGLIEMYLVGRWIEAQGYIILAKKK